MTTERCTRTQVRAAFETLAHSVYTVGLEAHLLVLDEGNPFQVYYRDPNSGAYETPEFLANGALYAPGYVGSTRREAVHTMRAIAHALHTGYRIGVQQ